MLNLPPNLCKLWYYELESYEFLRILWEVEEKRFGNGNNFYLSPEIGK